MIKIIIIGMSQGSFEVAVRGSVVPVRVVETYFTDFFTKRNQTDFHFKKQSEITNFWRFL